MQIQDELAKIDGSVRNLEKAGIKPAALAIVLGSGLKDFGDRLEGVLRVPFAQIEAFPRPKVKGHGGELLQGTVGGTLIHCLTGRVHQYEGHHPWEVVRVVRTLALLGTRCFLLTNAAGGVRDDLDPGDLMLIRDHLNLTATNPLIGAHDARLGPRFPPLSQVYDKGMGDILKKNDPAQNVKEGVYAQLLGPSYETPAEIRMVRTLGGDAVGMSTVPEAVALKAMECKVAALSLITNKAAGCSDQEPKHDEVVEEGKKAAVRLHALLERAIPALGAV